MTNEQLLFEDFLAFLETHSPSCMPFVTQIHNQLMQIGCTFKVKATKAFPFQVAYTAPNSRKGILGFRLRKKDLKARVTITDTANHSGIFARLPASMVAQMQKKNDCENLAGNGRCMEKCVGFDFHIGETHYQKCKFSCFEFVADDESIPFFHEMLDCELEARKC